MADGRSGTMQSGARSGSRPSGQQAGGGSLYAQAGNVVNDLTETASDLWDDVYDHGEQYYRQGRRAMGRLDGLTIGGLVAAGALGFVVAWMVYNNRTDQNEEQAFGSGGKRARRREKGRQAESKQRRRPSHG